MINGRALKFIRLLCGETAARRLHIARSILDGEKPKAQHVINVYGVSRATAKRDLRAVRQAVEETQWNDAFRASRRQPASPLERAVRTGAGRQLCAAPH